MKFKSISPVKPVIRIYGTKNRVLREQRLNLKRKGRKDFRRTLMDKKSLLCVKYR